MKYPKLWNGNSAVGEALVRQLQTTGAPYIRSSTADGVQARAMDGLYEVMLKKEDEFVAVTWYAWSGSTITTPPPYTYYNVYLGVRSYDFSSTDQPDGYYLRRDHQYLGPLILSGGGPVMDPVPYSYSVVTDGEAPGYYATETGGLIGKLMFSGTGHRLYKWAIVNVTKSAVVQRGVYEEDPLNVTRPRPFNGVAARNADVFTQRRVLSSGDSGSVTGQRRLHRMKSLAKQEFEPYLLFPWPHDEHLVVQMRWFGGHWWVLTQGTGEATGGSSYVFRRDGEDAWTQVFQTQAQYAWAFSATKYGIVIGGWDGVGNNILEMIGVDGALLATRKLGAAPLIEGVDLSKKYLFASTWSDTPADPSKPPVVRQFLLETLLTQPLDYFAPPENVIDVGGHSPDGEMEGMWLPAASDSLATTSRRVLLLYMGDAYDDVDGALTTGDVFVEVRSKDASNYIKTIKLDFASEANGYPSANSGAICTMR